METITNDNLTLSVTELCQEMVENAIKSRDNGDSLRVGVKTSGCNGYSYFMEFVDKDTPVKEGDITFNFSKIRIISDKKACLCLLA